MNIADIKAYCKNPNVPHSTDKSYYKVLYQQCVKILEGLSESEVQYLIKNHPSLIHFGIADPADAKFTNEVFLVSPTSLSCGTFGTTRSSKKYIHLNLRGQSDHLHDVWWAWHSDWGRPQLWNQGALSYRRCVFIYVKNYPLSLLFL